MADVHETNARIANAYDLQPWTQGYPDAVDPTVLQLLGKSYGGSGHVEDVLDLGCGTGSLLIKTARRTAGRLVGTDISAVSCARARENLAEFGERADIIAADILDLKAKKLGQFDLIYCTGVIYVVPSVVRQRIVALIGQCLKPGGTALISYYAGPPAALRAQLAKSLRAAAANGSDPADQAARGRDALDLLRPAMRGDGQFALALRSAFKHFDQLNDHGFFAEALNGEFEAISTAELNRSFRKVGIGFGTYLGYAGFKPAYSPDDRAMIADRLDLRDGGFRYALFVKSPATTAQAAENPSGDDPKPVGVRPLRLRRRVRRWLGHLFWVVFRV